MPGPTPLYFKPSRSSFRCSFIPFYLKALFLISSGTVAFVVRDRLLEENLADEINVDPERPIEEVATSPLVIHLNQGLVSEHGVFPLAFGEDEVREKPALVFPEWGEVGEQREKDETSTHFVQRHLLQVPIQANTEYEPVVVANPIPDQIIQIGERYTYDVSKVFSGDYLRLQATNLPDWLNLEYKRLGSYQTETGFARGVAVSGNTVFVANERAGLLILNVSDPSDPQWLSTYSTGSGSANGVAISGNTVFVANERAGLLILNVSNSSNPQLLSNYPAGNGTAYGVAVSDNTVFVANGNAGLLILNVSDPSNPQWLSTYPAGNGTAYGVTASRNSVFVANEKAGLLVLNVSDPSDPKLLSSYLTKSGIAHGVTVSGNTLFVAEWNVGLLILNVSDPSHPLWLSTYSAGSTRLYEVAISDDTAFVASYDKGLLILSVDDLFYPQLLGICPASGGLSFGAAVLDNTVFVANGNTGLAIPDFRLATLSGIPLKVKSRQKWEIDIAAQAVNGSLIMDTFQLTANHFPQLIKNTLTDQSILPREIFSLALESQQLFSVPDTSLLGFALGQVNHQGLPAWVVLDIYPALLSTYSEEGSSVTNDVIVSGNNVFMANREAGLLILDVSDSSHPQWLSTYPAGSGATMGVAVSGTTIFVANQRAGLLILNGSDLSNPQLLSTYPAESGSDAAYGVAILSDTVFVANWKAGLLILNVSDPSDPQLLSTYLSGNGIAYGIAVLGSIVFVGNWDAGLLILNVSDLSHPELLSSYTAGRSAVYGVAVSGSIVFMANWDAGLLILNVSNPAHPQQLSTYPAGNNGITGRVAVAGNTAFMASSNAGLLILNVSNLSHPQLRSTYPTGSDSANGVAISGNTVFVANDEGLYVLSISNQWQLKIRATPSFADAGNYPLVLRATDELGSSAFIPFTIRVEGSPKVSRNITWQYAEMGQPFSFNVPQDTFTHPNFDPLVFNLSYANQTALPSGYWLIFNSISVTLSGIPRSQDKGSSLLRLTAKDPHGETAYTDFNLTIVNPPQTIPGQPLSLVQDRPFNHTIQLESIFDGDGQPFNYTIGFLDQNEELRWLNYTILDTHLTLLGVPDSIGRITLVISAETPLGYRATTPFILSINPNALPRLRQAISSQTIGVGEKLDFVLPENTFEDSNGGKLRYSAVLADGTSLPEWLTFSQEQNQGGSWHFKGTPGGWDTNPFSARTMTIQLTAHNVDNASAIALFNLTVNGTSTLGLILKIGLPLLSILGLFQKRATFLNRVCYKRYQKPSHTLEVGQPFSLLLSTAPDSVGSIEVKTRHISPKGYSRFIDCQRFFKPPVNYLQLPFDPLPEGASLPKWMEYDRIKNTLEGVLPHNMNYRELFVFVKDRAGVVQEQFALKREGAVLEQKNEETPVVVRSKPKLHRKNVIPRIGASLESIYLDADPTDRYGSFEFEYGTEDGDLKTEKIKTGLRQGK